MEKGLLGSIQGSRLGMRHLLLATLYMYLYLHMPPGQELPCQDQTAGRYFTRSLQ